MVLADKILEGMTDRKIGTASSVKACNAFVGVKGKVDFPQIGF